MRPTQPAASGAPSGTADPQGLPDQARNAFGGATPSPAKSGKATAPQAAATAAPPSDTAQLRDNKGPAPLFRFEAQPTVPAPEPAPAQPAAAPFVFGAAPKPDVPPPAPQPQQPAAAPFVFGGPPPTAATNSTASTTTANNVAAQPTSDQPAFTSESTGSAGGTTPGRTKVRASRIKTPPRTTAAPKAFSSSATARSAAAAAKPAPATAKPTTATSTATRPSGREAWRASNPASSAVPAGVSGKAAWGSGGGAASQAQPAPPAAQAAAAAPAPAPTARAAEVTAAAAAASARMTRAQMFKTRGNAEYADQKYHEVGVTAARHTCSSCCCSSSKHRVQPGCA